MKKIRSYSSYAVSSSAFWFAHTSGYPRNSDMFLKKTITFLVSLLSVRKQRKEPCIVFLSTPSWWPILSGTHGATVLDVSTWLSLSTPAHCGTYTFYLSGIKIPSPSPDQSARSNLAAKEKANDVF